MMKLIVRGGGYGGRGGRGGLGRMSWWCDGSHVSHVTSNMLVM